MNEYLTDQEIQDLTLEDFYNCVLNNKYTNREISRITTVYLHFILHRLEQETTLRLLNDIFKHTYNSCTKHSNVYYLVALLRNCSAYKDFIEHWEDVLYLTKQCCIESLLDYRKELWGLYTN